MTVKNWIVRPLRQLHTGITECWYCCSLLAQGLHTGHSLQAEKSQLSLQPLAAH